MASIGGVACTYVKGAVPAAGRMKSERWHRAGINGEGVQLLGYGGVETTLTAVLYTNIAGAAVWAASLQALQGTIVTVINDMPYTSTSMFLEEVSNLETRPAYRPGTAVDTRGQVTIKAVRV